MKNRLFKKFSDIIFFHCGKILILFLILTAFSAYFSSKLFFESNFETLLPRTYDSVKALDDITKEFGGTGYLVLVVESDNLEKSKQFSAQLVKKLEKLPEVMYVNWRQPKKYFDDRKLLYVELSDLSEIKKRIKKKIDFEKQKANPLFIDLLDEGYKLDLSDIEKKYEGKDVFRDYYVSKDGRELVLLVKPAGLAGDLSFSKNLVNAAQRAIDETDPSKYDSSIKVSFTGRYKKQIDLNEQLQRDLKITGIGSTLLVIILLLLYFRQIRSLLLISVPIASGLLLTFASAYFMVGYVNIISAFLISILMGISADYGIVLYSRYKEERASGLDIRDGIEKMLSKTFEPIFVSGITTGLVFLSLTLAEFKGFSQFGLIASVGVFVNMFVFFTFFPALIIFFEKLIPISHIKNPGFEIKKVTNHFYLPVLAGSIIMVAYSVYGLKRASFEYNFSKIQGSNIPSFVLDERVNTIIGTSLTPDLALVDNLDEAKAVSNLLEEKLKNPDTTIDTYASILTFLPENQDEKLKELKEIKKILEESPLNSMKGQQKEKIDEVKKLLSPKPVTVKNLPKEILRMFYGLEGKRSSVFIFPKINLSDAALVRKSSDEIRNLPIKGKTIHPCSESIIFSDIINMVERDGRMILPLALLLTAIPVILAYRSIRSTFFILIPLAVGFLWIFGLTYFFRIEFNFFNVVVLPLIFGLGDDYGEYVYSRYIEEGRGSMPFVLAHTGPAVGLSAVTTSIGFGTLLFANHNGLKSIGLMAVMGILCVSISAVLLMPSLVTLFEKISGGKK